ncbi:YbjQ family protein [Paracoccus sp. PAR01]|uniref:YbjQ family protein n=1 Tax=Paracoccus sp. PAR01 TaxID=2769282 RepID=UPI001786BC6E|nr:YbjQ family protein [Paracoccus sp. PAR01]MBD9526209.1 YbjQ family protein [Paracoccus sp. PAR01]
MAACIDCRKKISIFEGIGGRCADCSRKQAFGTDPETEAARAKAAADKAEAERKAAERESQIRAVLLTTETASDLRVVKRLDVVTAECAFGMNIFKDLFASARDFFGGRSEAVQKTMRDARKTALYELRREAHLIGANAVVGVDLDYVELSTGGSMVMLVASGTAVVIAEPG